jgi:hypothetical protein
VLRRLPTVSWTVATATTCDAKCDSNCDGNFVESAFRSTAKQLRKAFRQLAKLSFPSVNFASHLLMVTPRQI